MTTLKHSWAPTAAEPPSSWGEGASREPHGPTQPCFPASTELPKPSLPLLLGWWWIFSAKDVLGWAKPEVEAQAGLAGRHRRHRIWPNHDGHGHQGHGDTHTKAEELFFVIATEVLRSHEAGQAPKASTPSRGWKGHRATGTLPRGPGTEGERGRNSQEGTIACQNYTPGELDGLPPPGEDKERRIEKIWGSFQRRGGGREGPCDRSEAVARRGCAGSWGHQGHQ